MWSIGRPGTTDFHFCGKPLERGGQYCQWHNTLEFLRQERLDTKRKREARAEQERLKKLALIHKLFDAVRDSDVNDWTPREWREVCKSSRERHALLTRVLEGLDAFQGILKILKKH